MSDITTGSDMTTGIVVIGGMLCAILLRVPVGVALALSGIAGNWLLLGQEQALAQVQLASWEVGTNFLLVSLPLFVLMGQLAHEARIAEDLYDCVYKWFARLPGGLASTSIITSAGFGAITGSSVVTVSTMGNMLMPELKKYHYNSAIASGSIASAGVLAILIPPSIPLVFYGAWTETSIGDLFIAGIIPGLLLTLIFCAYITIRCQLDPSKGPPGLTTPLSVRLRSLYRLLPVALVFAIVVGGIYGGWVTTSEAGAIGVMGVLIVGIL
ncbi:MAG: TRAP transporter large permease subunit, partial [Pseudomonadales bacterium]|nr:TRAP transporter large permease subunit [Pseudomonadales bacterium]